MSGAKTAMMTWTRALLVAAMLAVTTARAVEPGEMLADPRLEARARALSAELRCLVCQNQSIDDSNAPLARDLRLLVRERLVAGDSDAKVLDFVRARYGDFVLLRPRFSGSTALLWLTPLIVLAGIAAYVLARRRRGAPAPDRLSAAEERRLAEVLARAEERPKAGAG